MYYLNNFFTFSVFGHTFETIIYKMLKVSNKSGFMHLYWTPFYGCGVLINIFLYDYLSKKIQNKKIRILILSISLFIILSVLEFIGGIILLKFFNKMMWTYTNMPLHIGRFVSIPTSLLWVLMSILYLFVIRKFTDKLIKKIPPIITVILSFVFIVDLIVSIIDLI